MTIYLYMVLILGMGVAVAASVLSYREAKRTIGLVQETLRQSMQVNHAVNGKVPGDTTLSEDVTAVLDEQKRVRVALPDGGLIAEVVALRKKLDEALGGSK